MLTDSDVHSLATAAYSSCAERARAAALLLVDTCGPARCQVRLRWELHQVCLIARVLNQSIDAGMKDVDESVEILKRVHGFAVVSRRQEGAHALLKLQTTVARMNACYAPARRAAAFRSSVQAGSLALALWLLFRLITEGPGALWPLATRDDDVDLWDVDDEPP